MNNINTDVSRLQGATIPVGDDPIVASPAMPEPQKILAEPSVTVTQVSLDTLVDQLNQEYLETMQKLNMQRLAQTLDAMSARQEITDKSQKELLEKSTKLALEIKWLESQLMAARLEHAVAQDALEAAKRRKEPPATEDELKKLSDKVDAAEKKVSGLTIAVANDLKELNGLFQQLDKGLKAELMADFSAEPVDMTACIKFIRKQAKDEFKDLLPEIEALARLLGGDKMSDLIMETNGITA